ncbi:DsbA family protein [Paenibacillus sp. CAU 1782]
MSKHASKKTGKSKSRPIVLYTAIIIVLLVSIFAITRMSEQPSNPSPSLSNAPPIASQPVMGKEGAAISIVEFGDYKCPSCRAWNELVWPQLQKDYVDTGKATFAFINTMFFGEESRLGALAGETVLQMYPESFWEFHKALFAAQPNNDHNTLWLNQEKVLEIARQTISGFSEEEFLHQLTADKPASMVALDELLVTQSGVKATPTIMINDVVIADPFSYAEISKAIQEQLEKESKS